MFFPDRAAVVSTLEGMTQRARAFIRVHRVSNRSFKKLAQSLDILLYQAAISAELQAFNRPTAGIVQRASAGGGAAIYRGKLDLYGAVAILIRAPKLRKRLERIAERSIHADEACELMEEYRVLGLVSLTLNVGKLSKGLKEGPAQKSKAAADKHAWLDALVAKVFAAPSLRGWSSKGIEQYVDTQLEVDPAFNSTGLTVSQISARIRRQATKHRRALGIGRK